MMLSYQMRPLVRKTFSQYGRPVSSFLNSMNSSIDSLPHREAVLYKNKQLKWTANHFREVAVAHANALLDMQLVPGDRVAVWLPDKAEKHIAFLAAAMAGLVIVDVDPKNIQTKEDLREFLKLADSKLIYFDPTTDALNCFDLLRRAIPEYYYYDDKMGQPFHSKHFPKLKYFIHTGFNVEMGAINFKQLYVTAPIVDNVQAVQSLIKDDSPLYVKVSKGKSEFFASDPFTHKQIVSNESWKFAKNLVDKVYFEGY